MSNSRLSVALLAFSILGSPVARAESPAVPYVSILTLKVTEGDSGQTPFTAQLYYSGWPSSLTVKVTATPGTASETDYVFNTVEVSFPAGGGTQTVSGFIVGDLDPEGDEYFTLTATPTGTTSPSFVVSNGGMITIGDDDQARASRFHVEGLSLLEGNQGTTVAEARVALEPASASTVTVVYQTEDISAKAGEDYRAASGTLTFAPGEVQKTVPIDIIGDAMFESDESFAVVLSQPKLALIGTSRATVVIANDDAPVRATIADMEIDEGNDGVKSLPVVMTFDGPVPPFAKYHVSLLGAVAVADEDFRSSFQTLYPPEGSTQTTFTIEVLSDTLAECDEGFLIQYDAAYEGDRTVKVAKVLLGNDDGPVEGCADPFVAPTPVEPPTDAGASPPPPVDAGASPPPPVDAGTSPPPPVDAGAISATPDGGVAADVTPDFADGVTDARATSGIESKPDSAPGDGTTSPPNERLAKPAGCACSLASRGPHAGLVSLMLASVLVALARRRRRTTGPRPRGL